MRFQTLATAATLLTAIGASVIRRREIADGAKVTLIAEGEDCKLKLDNMQGCTGTSDPVGKVQDNRCIGGETKPIKVCNGWIGIHYDKSPDDRSHEVILDGETSWVPGDVFYNLNGTRGYVQVGYGIDCSNTYHTKGLWGGGCK